MALQQMAPVTFTPGRCDARPAGAAVIVPDAHRVPHELSLPGPLQYWTSLTGVKPLNGREKLNKVPYCGTGNSSDRHGLSVLQICVKPSMTCATGKVGAHCTKQLVIIFLAAILCLCFQPPFITKEEEKNPLTEV